MAPASNACPSIYTKANFLRCSGPPVAARRRCCACWPGFETPDSGRILLDGRDLAAVPVYRRPINMMFQNYALFPHLNVENNVAFGLKQDGLPKSEIATRVAQMLAAVRLEGYGKRKSHQLSGGERQRVALARSLVKRPRVLLLDEPLAALDKKLRGETQFEIMSLQEQFGLTFIIVTHDQQEAMTVADRIAVMNEGRLIQVGTPAEIYEQPNSRWVADFIGEVESHRRPRAWEGRGRLVDIERRCGKAARGTGWGGKAGRRCLGGAAAGKGAYLPLAACTGKRELRGGTGRQHRLSR